MIPLPPPLPSSAFRVLETRPVSELKSYFSPIVQALQEFLNDVEPLRRVQQVRGIRPQGRAFVRPERMKVGHWWFTHEGARKEAQWNVGMYPCHLRFGIGFNVSGGLYGDPAEVERGYQKFSAAMRDKEQEAPGFGEREMLEVEVHDKLGGVRVLPLIQLPRQFDYSRDGLWIFVGRILRSGEAGRNQPHPGCERHDDSEVLGDAHRLGAELTRVANVLWPFWLASRGR